MEKLKRKTETVEEFLHALKESDFYIEHIYLNGGCYQLYKILKTIFQDAKPYINNREVHVATLIGDRLYDINGFIGYIEDYRDSFKLMTPGEEAIANEWSFAENNDLYLGECPNCGEPIAIDRKKLVGREEVN